MECFTVITEWTGLIRSYAPTGVIVPLCKQSQYSTSSNPVCVFDQSTLSSVNLFGLIEHC